MTQRLSSPTAALLDAYDVVVVGSGYGGSIAASRLARAGKSVCVLERGGERQPGSYPNTVPSLLAEVQVDAPGCHVGPRTGMIDLRYNHDINVVVGCGLGGTSLINAGICLEPDARIFNDNQAWPAELREANALDTFFDAAASMLKPALTPEKYLASPKTSALQIAAQGLGRTITPVPVLVNFDRLDHDTNHVGVIQHPCVGCGDCISGCNYGAKSTLIMNYLPDAKSHHAQIFTNACARYVQPVDYGWLISGTIGDEGSDEAPFKLAAHIVILAAGTLGSTELLLRSRQNGVKLSDRLGSRFSGNGDTIGFAYNTNHNVNGIGLGQRASSGSSPIGPCSTAIVDWREASDSDTKSRVVMADGTVPGALGGVLASLLAVEAHAKGTDTSRTVRDKLRQRVRELKSNLLGPYVGATNNTLFFLAMAHDASMGHMYLEADKIRVDWPGLGNQKQFADASDLLRRATERSVAPIYAILSGML